MHEPLHRFAQGDGVGRFEHEDDRRGLHIGLLDLRVHLGPLRLVRLLAAGDEQVLDGRIVVAAVLGFRGREIGEVGRDLAGIGDVIGPVAGLDLEITGIVARNHGGVVRLLDRKIDAERRPHLLHGGERRRVVGAAGQGHRGQREPVALARLLQQSLRFFEIIGVERIGAVEQRRR